MLSSAHVIAFVTTSNPERAKSFYRDVLGLRFVADEPFALVFDMNGVMLRIAKVEQVTLVPNTVLGWIVPDIRRAIAELTAKQVQFQRYPGMSQDDFGVWTSPTGAQVAWFKDPDGNNLSLSEFPSAIA